MLAEEIIARDLTVREVEALVSGWSRSLRSTVAAGRRQRSPRRSRDPRDKDADTKAFEKEFSDLLGLGVEVQRGSGESGYLSIKYSNYEQLDYIRSRLLGTHTY